MMNKRKRLAPCLWLLLILQSASAQTDLPEVQANLAAYSNRHSPEKLFLHTDKDAYVAGDLVWFKVYAVEGTTNTQLRLSSVAYVELMDRDNKPVVRAKIGLGEKGGNGSLQLPLQLPTGHYLLRAYTSGMKNNGAAHFFEKQLTVFNTLLGTPGKKEEPRPAVSVRLYPEGGNLVAGLSSRVAFHLVDQKEKGVEGNGYLLNGKNDTLAALKPYKFGMGQFSLTPKMGETYKVVFSLADGVTVTQLLPTVHETGFVMQVEDAGSDRFRISVSTNATADNNIVYLLAQTRQQVKSIQKINASNGKAVSLLNKQLLGEGVSQLTIFNEDKKPVCERLVFIPPSPAQPKMLQAAKENFSGREKVQLTLSTPLTGRENLSLSVYQLDEMQAGEATGIDTYLWLTSELSGTVEQPSFYFSGISQEVQQATDLLLLTKGWRRFQWEEVLKKPAPAPYPIERSGQLITAKVTDKRTNDIAANVQVYLSIPATPYKLFTAVSDSAGLAHIHVKDFYGPGELIVQTNGRADSMYKVDILTPFSEAAPVTQLPLLTPSSTLQAALANNSISMQARYIYRPENTNRFLPPVLNDTLPFYGKGIVQYDLDEYVRFNTVEEVLREYVREINVGVKGSGTSLRIKLFNVNDRELYTDDILVLVDGIPLFYPNKIFDLNPLKLKQLDVLPVNYILGDAIFHAVANFSSYNSPYTGLVLDPNAVTVDDEGLQLQRIFYAPEYASVEQQNSRLPDLRTTLLWMPDVMTQQPVFYTGDNKGRFLAVLQGIDADGKAFHTSTAFSVQ